jgi:hypothetical protein
VTPREREQIEYEIESLLKAENHERFTRNRSQSAEDIALCSMRISELVNAVYRLRGRLMAQKRTTRRPIM